jgi:peptide/nickel transport system ATP-binding protein/oligopeptide transport system ATP-binding protein
MTDEPAQHGSKTVAPAGEVILSARDVVKHFPVRGKRRRAATDGVVHAVCGVSFDLHEGETLGIVGESGCGKSTLGRTVLNLQPATSGEVVFRGRRLSETSGGEMRQLRRKLQIVFQDPFSSLDPRLTVSAAIAEALQIHGIDRQRRDARVRSLMATVGLDPSYGTRFPHEFSGGQRQRVGIARALALEPDVIVLDEPVSALDVSIQAGVINLLEDLQADHKVAYLFITHDLAVVRHISHRVAVMYLGRIVEIGDREDVFENPAHPYTQSLISAAPIPDPRRERSRPRITLSGEVPSAIQPPSGCRFRTRCPIFATMLTAEQQQRCLNDVPQLTDRGQGHPTACHYPTVTKVL